MDRQSLKQSAKDQIKGHIFILFLISLIAGILGGILKISYTTREYSELLGEMVNVTHSINIGSYLITPAFTISIILVFLNLAKDITPAVKDVFAGFKMWWPAVKVNFFVVLFTTLWTFLFIIPGMIKSISYSMSMYILAENPEMGALEAITRSRKMMHGHKMESFILSLSFIGWILLGVITIGIAFIWVGPYMEATYANYYNYLKKENGIY